MLALVSVEAKEIVPILSAHIFTVCPTAVPTLPHPKHDATEENLMESLGMLRLKDGQFESFERFLSRTEVSCEDSASVIFHVFLAYTLSSVFRFLQFTGSYIVGGEYHGV